MRERVSAAVRACGGTAKRRARARVHVRVRARVLVCACARASPEERDDASDADVLLEDAPDLHPGVDKLLLAVVAN
eukprot:1429090-Pleurochrysis_carterae.AAC.1